MDGVEDVAEPLTTLARGRLVDKEIRLITSFLREVHKPTVWGFRFRTVSCKLCTVVDKLLLKINVGRVLARN